MSAVESLVLFQTIAVLILGYRAIMFQNLWCQACACAGHSSKDDPQEVLRTIQQPRFEQALENIKARRGVAN